MTTQQQPDSDLVLLANNAFEAWADRNGYNSAYRNHMRRDWVRGYLHALTPPDPPDDDSDVQ